MDRIPSALRPQVLRRGHDLHDPHGPASPGVGVLTGKTPGDTWNGRRVLVTGGAGFIGAHLCRALLDAGARVRVLDDLSTGRRESLPLDRHGVDLQVGSVADEGLVRALAAGCDTVFHQAAVASVPASFADPARTHAVNATGTLNVYLAALEGGVRRVVAASSAAVYGERASLPAREDAPLAPASPYATTKALGEWYAGNLAAARGLHAVSLRYFNVYGPGQDPGSPYAGAIPLFVRAIREGRRVTVHGDGRQTRDFVHVADAVRANLLAADAPVVPGSVFNVGTGRAVSVNDLIAAIAGVSGRAPVVAHGPPRPGDVPHSRACPRRSRSELGFVAEVALEDGLAGTCTWYREAVAR